MLLSYFFHLCFLFFFCIEIKNQTIPIIPSSAIAKDIKDSLFTRSGSIDTSYKIWQPVNDSLHYYIAAPIRYWISNYDTLIKYLKQQDTSLHVSFFDENRTKTIEHLLELNRMHHAIVRCSMAKIYASLEEKIRDTMPYEPIDFDVHDYGYMKVYVNDVGRKAMFSRKPQFPVGSVIIKEKFSPPTGERLEMIGMMIKRDPGYDSAGGDWQYVAALAPDMRVIESGLIPTCRKCHAYRKDMDFVYRGYMNVP